MTNHTPSFTSASPLAIDDVSRPNDHRKPRPAQPRMRQLRSTIACGAAVMLMSSGALTSAAKAGPIGLRIGALSRPAAFLPMKASGSESVLQKFAGTNGARPAAGLVELNGSLYGTTLSGGSNNEGAVYAITPAGAAHVVYSFKAGTDGNQPTSALTVINGALYGETFTGGLHGAGTVFEVTPSGAERIVYSFKGGSDGANPESNLIDVNGTLYGTTANGGSNGGGVIFSVNLTTAAERILHTFGNPTTAQSDGANPTGQLADVNGTIYGTTVNGSFGACGTVFGFTTSGAERSIYAFRGGLDGCSPTGGLTAVSGTLYGTTATGGYQNRLGTVFEVTPSGQETVLHAFAGGADGANPMAPLTLVNGALYGTTFNGGTYAKGTVFSLRLTSTAITEAVLHSFSGSPDGANPEAGLLDVNGTLYGTTNLGGQSSPFAPFGTVFTVVP